MLLVKQTIKENELSVNVFVTGHAGMPLKLIDQNGKIQCLAAPDDWGAVTREEWGSQPLRFQGQYFDEESGFYYNRYRYYDPQYGRYITQDPIGLAGGMNGYVYPTNPVEWVDPLGLCASLQSLVPNTHEMRNIVHEAATGQKPSGQTTGQAVRGAFKQLASEMKGTLSAGVGVTAHSVIMGGTLEAGVSVGMTGDRWMPKACTFVQASQVLGPGAAIDAHGFGSVSNAPPAPGPSYTEGFSASGGVIGDGGFSVVRNPKKHTVITTTGSFGVGLGGSVGPTISQTYSLCTP
jgi:RHS repeat-associated protein